MPASWGLAMRVCSSSFAAPIFDTSAASNMYLLSKKEEKKGRERKKRFKNQSIKRERKERKEEREKKRERKKEERERERERKRKKERERGWQMKRTRARFSKKKIARGSKPHTEHVPTHTIALTPRQ